MQFNSLTYLLFLPAAFALHWGLPPRFRNQAIVLASFVFYGWWDWRFLGLMVLTCGANWLAARLMGRTRHRRAACLGAVAFNLGVLGLFKYYDFFAGSLSALLRQAGVEAGMPLLHLVLPVGISFYTFQVTGYIVDVYRRQAPAAVNAWQFFAFISFFPQLVAGPIERSGQLLPQFASGRRFDRAEATDGMRRILWGLMKKMLLADNCGAVADQVFAGSATATMPELWMGVLCFAFQIYGDFSGYSDMAIGSAKLFGIRLMDNFDRPYLSRSVPEFWRRWHISLMTWLRDYVYIPLGGSREGLWKKWRNTLAVFALSGLWHGAGWTFVAWGLYHALLFLPYSLPLLRQRWCGLAGAAQVAATFVLVLVGWVFFRADSIGQAAGYLRGMFSLSGNWAFGYSRLPLLYIIVFMAAEALCRRSFPLDIAGRGVLRLRAVRMGLYLSLFLLTLLLGGRPATFIYFQF